MQSTKDTDRNKKTASNLKKVTVLRDNERITTPPQGQPVLPGGTRNVKKILETEFRK